MATPNSSKITNLFTELSNDSLRSNRQMIELKSALQLLNIAIQRYNNFFGYETIAKKKLNTLRQQMENLSRSGASNANMKIIQTETNTITKNYGLTYKLIKSSDARYKQLTLEKIINIINNLIKAFNDVYKKVLVIDSATLFKKPSSIFYSNDRDTKKENLLVTIMDTITLLKGQRNEFTKLQEQLSKNQEAILSSETASELNKRLNNLRGPTSAMFKNNSLLKTRQEKLNKTIRNIQRKLNTYVGVVSFPEIPIEILKGGKRSSRRSTRKLFNRN